MVIWAKSRALIPPSSIYVTLTEIGENKHFATVPLILKLFQYNWTTWAVLKAWSELFIKKSSCNCSQDFSHCHLYIFPDRVHQRVRISLLHNIMLFKSWLLSNSIICLYIPAMSLQILLCMQWETLEVHNLVPCQSNSGFKQVISL